MEYYAHDPKVANRRPKEKACLDDANVSVLARRLAAW
jgi:hypothetical protein